MVKIITLACLYSSISTFTVHLHSVVVTSLFALLWSFTYHNLQNFVGDKASLLTETAKIKQMNFCME